MIVSNLPTQIESYGTDWTGPLRSNRQVTYAREQIRIDALAEHTNTIKRDINDDTGSG